MVKVKARAYGAMREQPEILSDAKSTPWHISQDWQGMTLPRHWLAVTFSAGEKKEEKEEEKNPSKGISAV